MRYPDQFAYKFEIEETIADVEIPKFIIQPLVENYFVHGIDYQRQDNAIKVHAYREGEKLLWLLWIMERNHRQSVRGNSRTFKSNRNRHGTIHWVKKCS